MAMQQLDVPAQTGKGGKWLKKKKRDGDKRGKSAKSQFLLSASMEFPVSSGEMILTQGEGYNPLAWESMPAALKKQFPHWQDTCPVAKHSHEECKDAEDHPFLFSATHKPQVQPVNGIPYIVMDSDTLNSISLKFDTTPGELARLNKRPLAGFSIFSGDVVYVPDGEEPPSLPAKKEDPRKSAPPFLHCNSPTPDPEPPAVSKVKRPSKKQLQLTKSQELLSIGGKELEVKPGRKRTLSSSARLEQACDQTPPPHQDEETDTHVSLCTKYISNDQGCVHGTLIISTSAILFKPHLSDPLVQEHGASSYEILIPLSDVTHACITREVTPPQRPPYSPLHSTDHRSHQPQAQSTQDDVAMETQDLAMPTSGNALNKSASEGNMEQSSGSPAGGGRERDKLELVAPIEKGEAPAIRFTVGGRSVKSPSVSETGAESEQGLGNDVTPEVQGGVMEEGGGGREKEEGRGEGEVEGGKEETDGGEEKGGGETREGDGEGGGGREEEGRNENNIKEEGDKVEDNVNKGLSSPRQPNAISSEMPQSLEAGLADGGLTSNEDQPKPSDPLSGSADDLLAIMGSGEPLPQRAHTESQTSTFSLDAMLAGADTFLHLRVVSKSGHRYTYVPVTYVPANSDRGVDIPTRAGAGRKAASPPVQCIKTLFCFVVPERNLEGVVSFLSIHHPQGSAHTGSPSDHHTWTDGYFEVIRGPRIDNEDLSFCDDHFKNPDSWEIYSLKDLHKFRSVINRMEVEENLPLPHMVEESNLLTEDHLKKLTPHLPSQAVGHDMHLVYSTFTHGISLRTMYRNMLAFGDSPILFVVRDDSDKIFGAMASSYLKLSDHFYGTGESFLFSFTEDSVLDVYTWTGLNSYFIKGNTDSIAIGSGEGHFGLWLDENFLHGSSYNCATYGNRPLATTEDFLCTGVEAWGFL